MIKNTPISKVFPDKANPLKADQARLGLLRLSLAKLGFIRVSDLLSGESIGAHALLRRHVMLASDSSCIFWVGRTNRGGYGRVEFRDMDWLALYAEKAPEATNHYKAVEFLLKKAEALLAAELPSADDY